LYISAPVLINVSHDDIAPLFKISSKNFEETYQEKVNEMKRTFLEYVKTLKNFVSSAGAGSGYSTGQYCITMDPQGFPILPLPESWDKISKEELERLYRVYITQHYSK
jgi:hypothetical protein